MKNLPKEKRDRLILVIVGTVTIVVGLYYAVILSQRKTLASVAKKKEEQENKFSSAQRLTGSVDHFRKDLDASAARLKSIESTMASGDMYSWIILTVNSFKENYQVDIPQFSREVPGEVGMYGSFPYKAAIFHIRGTAFYHDFGRFVADFENTFPFMRIQNIELEPSGGSNANKADHTEKLAFKLEIVALVNPHAR
jgi:Tfp pilus assembly protein PilO